MQEWRNYVVNAPLRLHIEMHKRRSYVVNAIRLRSGNANMTAAAAT